MRKQHRALELPRNSTLQLDHTRQTILQNWSEYQDRQLDRLQGLKDEEAALQNKLNARLSPGSYEDFQAFQFSMNYSFRRIEALSSLLEWIEWEWHRIAALEKAPSQKRRRPANDIASTMACTGRRYNLRPRTNGRTTQSQLHSTTPRNATKCLGLARTRSGRVSKPVTR